MENLRNRDVLPEGMYTVLEEWYEFIQSRIHVQADLIGTL